MNDEELEGFVESLEVLVTTMHGLIESMQERLAKLEQQQAAAEKNAPFHLSVPMREYAERKTVGFKGNSFYPMPRESSPQLRKEGI